jgi:hypothetical protein
MPCNSRYNMNQFINQPAGNLIDHFRLTADDLTLNHEPPLVLSSFSFRMIGKGVNRWARVFLDPSELFSLECDWPISKIREARVLEIKEGSNPLCH